MTKPTPEVLLSELQLALMRVLWDSGEASAGEVAEALRPGRRLAYTTVATLLARLEKRGVLASIRDGRQLRYRALLSEAAVRRSMVSGLLASLFGGNAGALLSHLVDEREVGRKDLEQIRELLSKGRRR
jgi:predicted transcriptional regulator